MRGIRLAFVMVGALVSSALPASAAMTIRNVSGPTPLACPANDRSMIFAAPDVEEEPSIAIHPTDVDTMVVSWLQDAGLGVVTAATHDGGTTWHRRIVPGLTTCTGGTHDRVVHTRLTFGPDGALYLGTTPVDSFFPDPRNLVSRIAINRSDDAGLTWGTPSFVDGGGVLNDFDTIAAEPDVAGAIDVVWSPLEAASEPIVLSRSVDAGRTWTRHTVRGPRPMEIAFSSVIALPDGTLLVATHDFAVASFVGAPDEAPVTIVRSADKALTWSDPVQLAPDGVLGWPMSAVAPDGTVYVAWRTDAGDGWEDVWMTRSLDSGRTWAEPMRALSRKGAGSPLPAMSADGTGRLAIVFFDGSADATDDGRDMVEVRLATSADGGATWGGAVLATYDARPYPYTGVLLGLAGAPSGFAAAFPLGAPEAVRGATDIFVATT